MRSKPFHALARVCLFYLGSVLTLIFTSSLTKNPSVKGADLYSIFLATAITFLLVVVFARWEQLNLRNIGLLADKNSVKRWLIGYAVGFLMAVIQALIVLSFGHFHLVLAPQMAVSELALTLGLYFLVACREELVFRSYALRSLQYAFTPAMALLVITLLFIVEHVLAGMTWKLAIIGSGLGGILFGLSALKTKGLALPLGLHSAWNFGQWCMGFKNQPGIWEAVVEKGYESQTETIGLATFALVMVLAIAGVAIFGKWEKLSPAAHDFNSPGRPLS